MMILASSLMVVVAVAQLRPVPPAFARSSGQGRAAGPLELEPHQTMPQPFRKVSLPLHRGRGFSLDGQEPKPVQAVPQPSPTFQPRQQPIENNEFIRVEENGGDEDAADGPQPTRQAVLQQKLTENRFQQQQTDNRFQQQQLDRAAQQQQQPEKQFGSGFRPQPQTQGIETQPQFVRKVVQRPLKRVQAAEESAAASKSPETVQRLKFERNESADKQRAKKPVSQVLRRYRDDNPDGSITWGFENDDGTFKEETIGVDCVTRGKYGYVDPEGVKREYSYQSGIPCDKNRKPMTGQSDQQHHTSSAVQEAQASDTYGYIDYSKNQYVMANGQTINLNGMARNRARKPVARKTTVLPPFHRPADGEQQVF